MNKSDKIYVAGHNGLVGSAVCRRLAAAGFSDVVTRSRAELDLCDQNHVRAFFDRERPKYVFLAAAKVGGVYANDTYRADFIYENLMIQSNVIHQAFVHETAKLLFFSSADMYPKNCPQPAKEEYLFGGPLEPTCEPFAVAKLAGAQMCESYNRQYGTDFTVAIAPNVYGPHQRYDSLNAQVVPSLLKKFYEAKASSADEVVIWGAGGAQRDFLYSDDLADAAIFIMKESGAPDFFNVGTGSGYTIARVAEAIKKAVGYGGRIVFDKTKPEGAVKKLLDVSKITELGWKAGASLDCGLAATYDSFVGEMSRKEARVSIVCNISLGRKDSQALKKIQKGRGIPPSEAVEQDFRNKIVIKPWGHEFLVFENEETSVWFLYLKKGHSTSMHCHPGKNTSLIILSGKAMSSTFSSRNYLKGGDAIIIEKGVFHFTKVLSDDGLCMFEIESPPLKTDLVRLEDRYGRAELGYESEAASSPERLKEYGYFHFKDTPPQKSFAHADDRFTAEFEVFADAKDFQDRFKIDDLGCLYTSCRGNIVGADGRTLLASGGTQKADVLFNAGDMSVAGRAVILKTCTRDRQL